MRPLGFHLVLRLEDDRPIAPTIPARRVAARLLLEMGAAAGLFAFDVVDTHLHAGLAASREEVGRFCQRAEVALRARLDLDVPFAAPRVRPFEDAWHRQRTLRYILGQALHHGVAGDPFREGSILPDLVGLRRAGPSPVPLVLELFPRVRRADLLTAAGLPPFDELLAPAHLADAAAAAVAVALPTLATKAPAAVAARAAAVHAARDLGVPSLAAALGISERTIRDLAARPTDPGLVRAVRLQMGLRSVVSPRTGLDAPDAGRTLGG